MSDCKHKKRSEYIESSHYVSYCQHCDADFTKFELETLERAEKAEARVKELEFAVMNREGYIETLESIIAKTQLQINGITINRKRK